MQQKVVKQDMNDGITVGKSLLWHMISYNLILYIAKVGTFPLSCYTIIHLLFHYFVLQTSVKIYITSV